MSVLQQTGDNCLLTPEPILDRVREFLGGSIALDPCTTHANPTDAEDYLTPAEDGLAQNWTPGTFWNPPFGALKRGGPSQCYAWARKAREEARRGNWSIGLLPCDTGRQSSKDWHEHVLCRELSLYCVIRGRTRFDRLEDGRRVVGGGGKSPTYTTGLYLYIDPDDQSLHRRRSAFIRVFRQIGAIMPGRIA